MDVRRLLGVAALAPVTAGVALGIAVAGSSSSPSARVEARSVVQEFFWSINAKDYPTTCALLSTRFYRENRIPDRNQCAWRLTLGFAWMNPVRFRIVGIRVDGDRAAVNALAGGAPGRVVLVREDGRFKILSVGGS